MYIHLAYLDPNSGSILAQAAIGGVLGAGFVLRKAVGNITGKITSIIRKDRPSDTGAE